MKTRRVFFDVDGTIADLMGKFVSIYNEKHGTTVSVSELVEYNFSKNLPIEDNIQGTFASINYDTVDSFEHMVEAFKAVETAGYEMVIITAPMWDHCFQLSQKKEWLEQKVGHHVPVVVTEDKGCCLSNRDILIDDAPKYMDQWLDNGGLVIRVKQPWNSEYTRANYSIEIDEYASVNILKFINGLVPIQLKRVEV